MKKIQLASLLLIILFPFAGITQTHLSVKEYGVTPGKEDATPGLMKALEACRQLDDPVLSFPKGEYHFYPYFGIDKYCFISNNDEGLKRIIFPLFDFHDLVIEGQGSSFIFHGFVNPFDLAHYCEYRFC